MLFLQNSEHFQQKCEALFGKNNASITGFILWHMQAAGNLAA